METNETLAPAPAQKVGITPRQVGFTATAVVRSGELDAGKGIIRVHNSRIDRKGAGKDGFRRREPVILINSHDPSCWVVGVVMGAGRSIEGLSRDSVALDYDQRDALGLHRSESEAIEVRPATHTEVFRYYWNHPDPGMSLATRLGALGVALGVVGAVLGLVGLVISL
ncbi:hypothetical protein E4T66_17925 [Sinimarinibacterium sp. CAU 1509]|uniref:hypothetical protein n=1 Tax=Sinimarinibacterium sp. CAU 1509 TaxID=2562283 RepID=UPI0010AC7175|nr:hypothetical protein [Sinimarinibacterium sp. CAU 1509]TJY57284.1 hypothetical protein E4T66_17925 [Sinimarinibacterium sp. CAU 1509]